MDWWDRPVAKAYRVRQENRVPDQRGHLALPDREEMSEVLDLKVWRVSLDHKDCVVLLEPSDCQDPQDRLVHQELLDPKDLEVIPVSVADKVLLVPLAQLAQLVLEARLDRQDQPDFPDQMDHLVQKVHKASGARVDRLASLVSPVIPDQLDPQACQDLAVLLASPDRLDLMAQ